MVTKQQQLEWLAKEFDVWPGFGHGFVRMSTLAIGEPNGGLGIAHHITIQEWQQERDKMSSKQEVDNSWHERGELPPVGCECWYIPDGKPCFIAAKHCAIDAVIFSSTIGGGELFYGYYGDFRPLRTEREKSIDSLIEIICAGGELSKDGSAAHEIAERIHDAGYRKVNP